MSRIVNRAEFAEIVGRSPRTVGEWIAEGMPAARSGKKGEEVRIDTEAAIAWLVRREAEKLAGGGSTPESGSYAEETIGLIRAKRIYQELLNAEKENQLGSIEEMSQAASAAMVIVGSQLDGLAGRLAATLAGMTDAAEIRELLLDECRRIRMAAADRLEAFFAVAPGGEPVAPPTEAGPVAMGGD